jgi:hypothetical protein
VETIAGNGNCLFQRLHLLPLRSFRIMYSCILTQAKVSKMNTERKGGVWFNNVELLLVKFTNICVCLFCM